MRAETASTELRGMTEAKRKRTKDNVPAGKQITVRKGMWRKIRKTELLDVDESCRMFLSGTAMRATKGGNGNIFEKWGGRRVRLDVKIKGAIQTVSVRRSQRVMKRITYR